MEGIRRATVSNFNELLDAQKTEAHGDEARISIYSFNHTIEKLCFRAPLESARHLTTETYLPSGRTALYDAVCSTLNEITGAEKENLANEWKIVRIVCIFSAEQAIGLLVLLFWIIRNLYFLIMSLFLIDGRDGDGETVKVADAEFVSLKAGTRVFEGVTTLMTEHAFSVYLDDSGCRPVKTADHVHAG